jgi:anti-sigma factor RsiW
MFTRWTRLMRTLFAILAMLLVGAMVLPALLLATPATASPPMAQLLVAPLGVAVLLIGNMVSIPYLGPLIAFLALMTAMASTARIRVHHPLRE